MRRFLLFILMLVCCGIVSAAGYTKSQHRTTSTSKCNVRYRFSGIVGWLNRDDKIAGDKNTIGFTMDRPVVTGGTFAMEFLPTGSVKCMQQWNNASIGAALTVLDLGQDQYLGQVIAPHTYLNIPLVRREHFVFGLRPGVGVAFVTKTYANTVPDDLRWKQYRIKVEDMNKDYLQVANVSIGSIVNAFLVGGIYMDFPIKKGWNIAFSAGWQHLSNGSVMTPNAGYNMFNAEVGFAYTPSEGPNGHYTYTPPPDVPKELWDGVNKKWDVEIGLAGGCRSVYYKDRKWYGLGSFSLSAHWVPISIFRLGAGVDVFYDGAYYDTDSEYKKTYITESKVENCFRVGISLQPEFIIGDLTVGYHIGMYLYDPIKNLEPYTEVEAHGGPLNRGILYSYDVKNVSNGQDGWCYQKLQLKYHCTKHLFVQLGLKLHFVKAEFIDVGLGVRI